MKIFFKLFLFLGFIGGVSTENYSAQMDAPIFDERGAPSISPLQDKDSASSRLLDAVFKYSRPSANCDPLFKNPDVNVWAKLYAKATGKSFSTLDLIDLLDTTKADILNACRNVTTAKAAGIYSQIPKLFDNAMRQIFAGCWGISDEPAPASVVDRLKGVYGRVVSGMLTREVGGAGDLFESLEKQKQNASSGLNKAHFAALQECAAAVLYSVTEPEDEDVSQFIDKFKEKHSISLSQDSFKETLKKISYENPYKGIQCRLASRFFNPDDKETGTTEHTQDSISMYGTPEGIGKTQTEIEATMNWYHGLFMKFIEENPNSNGSGFPPLLAPRELKALSEENIQNILLYLPTDDRVEVLHKYFYLKALSLRPYINLRALNKAVFKMFSGLDPNKPVNYIVTCVLRLSRELGGKVSFTSEQQKAMLDLYEKALLQHPKKNVLSLWVDLLNPVSFFSPKEVLSKLEIAVGDIKLKLPGEDIASFLSKSPIYNSADAEIQEKLRALSTFTHSTSHEIDGKAEAAE